MAHFIGSVFVVGADAEAAYEELSEALESALVLHPWVTLNRETGEIEFGWEAGPN